MTEPDCPQKSPCVIEEQPGKRHWCSCGRSSNQPYCDGKHKGTDFTPVAVEIVESGKVAWCACKKSGNPPFCDGSHRDI